MDVIVVCNTINAWWLVRTVREPPLLSHPQVWHGHPARDYYIIHGLEGRATLRLRLPPVKLDAETHASPQGVLRTNRRVTE